VTRMPSTRVRRPCPIPHISCLSRRAPHTCPPDISGSNPELFTRR
jgi:hypothetical protein